MKKIRILTLAMMLILLVSLLVGCGADSYYKSEAGQAAGPTGGGIYENSAEKENTTVETGRKLIRTVTIRAETADQDALLADLNAKVAQLGGYVQSKNVNNNQSSYRNANLVLRIPAEKLDHFVDHVQGETNILSVIENAEDITMSYIDVQSHITALETEESRLLELIAQAENLNDLLLLESKLTDVRTKLENYRSQLKNYDNKVDYATVNLNITEVKEFTVVEEEDPTVWQRIGSGLGSSMQDVWSILKDVFVFHVVALPYVAMLAVIPFGVLVIIRLVKKHKHKKEKSV